MTTLMAVPGVLMAENGGVIREGAMLYRSFIEGGERVILMADESKELTEHWLLQSQLYDHSGVLTPSLDLNDGAPLRERQLSRARADGRVDLVIDADPKTVKHCMEVGVPSMLFAHPRFSRPNYRPDGPANLTWEQIAMLMEAKKMKGRPE